MACRAGRGACFIAAPLRAPAYFRSTRAMRRRSAASCCWTSSILFRFFFAYYTRYAGEIKTARLPLFFSALALLLVASRLCHLGILWEGDALPLATARQMLFGKTIYRDIWNDKPPLVAMFYLLAGARGGWPLRLLDALYAWIACWAAYRFARDVWSEREGLWAAALTGFFLIFDFPATAIPVASDLCWWRRIWLRCGSPGNAVRSGAASRWASRSG